MNRRLAIELYLRHESKDVYNINSLDGHCTVGINTGADLHD